MIPDKIYFPADGLPAYIDWDGSPIRTKQVEDSDICYIRKDIVDDMLKTAEDHAFLAGSDWQKEQMMKEAVKWLVDDDYDELTDKGRFILGSVGIGYNGYYIPYSDLLKLPKED